MIFYIKKGKRDSISCIVLYSSPIYIPTELATLVLVNHLFSPCSLVILRKLIWISSQTWFTL